MKLIVGLGNPGRKYEQTRHNVGFMAAAKLAALVSASPSRIKFEGELAEGTAGGEKLLILCPQTFMNASGQSVRKAIDFLSELGTKSGVTINMHLNPTYAAVGTALADAHANGEYEPPKLKDVARAVAHGRDSKLSIFVGLYDEGLAVPGGSFLRPGDEPVVELLEQFNRTQDYRFVDEVIAG